MPLTVLSYNILEGGPGRLDPLAAVIRRARPDAVAILEANWEENVRALAARLGMAIVFGEANSAFHVAWLTRLPLAGWQNHRLPSLAKTLLELRIEWEGQPLALFATHLHHDPLDEDRRVAEVGAILDVVRGCPCPHLLVGDFNALAPGDPVGPPPDEQDGQRYAAARATAGRAIPLVLDAGDTDCYRALHPDAPGYTYRADHPWLRIDYAFASPGLASRLVACDVLTGDEAASASDHFPLVATFG